LLKLIDKVMSENVISLFFSFLLFETIQLSTNETISFDRRIENPAVTVTTDKNVIANPSERK